MQMSPELARLLEEPVVHKAPLNAEQREMVAGYMRVRGWVVASMPFDQHDERVAGFISEDV